MRKWKKVAKPNIDIRRHSVDGEEFKINGVAVPRGIEPTMQMIYTELGDTVETDYSEVTMKRIGFELVGKEMPKPEQIPKEEKTKFGGK